MRCFSWVVLFSTRFRSIGGWLPVVGDGLGNPREEEVHESRGEARLGSRRLRSFETEHSRCTFMPVKMAEVARGDLMVWPWESADEIE